MTWSNLSDLPTPSVDVDLLRLQQDWLMQCLLRNHDTDFGRSHDFSSILSIADFQKQVPICEYQNLYSWIQEMADGEQDILFAGKTVAFELTSGSTSAQKLIPYSVESLEDFRRALWPWLLSLPQRFEINSGTAYWAISPATRQPRETSGGIPIGLPDSAYLGADLSDFFLQVSAVPFWVAELQDFDQWQLATLYFLTCSADLNLISVWSPTFLSTLLDALLERRSQLEQALTCGLNISQHNLSADPSALQRLQAYYQSHNPEHLWPNLKLVSCWADGSSWPYYQDLVSRFDNVTFQPKGLLSTESVLTVPDHNDRTLLTPQSGFYEFIDKEGDAYLAHELQKGREYQVIVTTAGGLYRYRSGDNVCCHGYVDSLPQLEFIGRTQTSDLAGEKLSETFVNSCLKGIPGFRMLLPVKKNNPGYCLVLETVTPGSNIQEQIEQELCRNPHYAYARKLGQLQPLKLLRLDTPTKYYLDESMQRGTRLGDVKLPALCLDDALFIEHLQRAV